MEDDASIALGPLKIWILGRQFPDHHDYWDGNWLSATARCNGVGSQVEVSGAFLHLGELKKWKEDLEAFQGSLKGSVALPTIEPTLRFKIGAEKSSTGHLSCEAFITADQITESHRYLFTADQSYLPGLIGQVAAILRAYPIRNEKTG